MPVVTSEIQTDILTNMIGINGRPSTGKCLGYGTKILMFDGSIKQVQDVVVGDKLMGPDSTPRVVKQTNTGRGKLFKIKPIKGEEFICNENHILSLVRSDNDEIFDLPLNDYLKIKENNRIRQKSKLYSVGVNFKKKKTNIDPYILGAWLGDGDRKGRVHTPDKEIYNEFKKFSEKIDQKISFSNSDKRCPSFYVKSKSKKNYSNIYLSEIIRCQIDGQKYIPKEYLINCEENRLKLLAGLLDTDGYRGRCGTYFEISCKGETLANQIVF